MPCPPSPMQYLRQQKTFHVAWYLFSIRHLAREAAGGSGGSGGSGEARQRGSGGSGEAAARGERQRREAASRILLLLSRPPLSVKAWPCPPPLSHHPPLSHPLLIALAVVATSACQAIILGGDVPIYLQQAAYKTASPFSLISAFCPLVIQTYHLQYLTAPTPLLPPLHL